MKSPGVAVVNPARYFVARKHAFELLCMALTDAHMRFTYYDISHEPQSHDSLAWKGTALGARIARGELPAPFFINADNAFISSNSMVVPGGGSDFDFYQVPLLFGAPPALPPYHSLCCASHRARTVWVWSARSVFLFGALVSFGGRLRWPSHGARPSSVR